MIFSPIDLISTLTLLKVKNKNPSDSTALTLSSSGFSFMPVAAVRLNNEECQCGRDAMVMLLNHAVLAGDGSEGCELAERMVLESPALFHVKCHSIGLGSNKKKKPKRVVGNIRLVTMDMAENIVKANVNLNQPATLKLKKGKIKLIFPDDAPGKTKFGYLLRGMKSKKSSASLPPLSAASPEQPNSTSERPVPLARHSSTGEAKGTVKNSQARGKAFSNEYTMPDDDKTGNLQKDTEINKPSDVLVAQGEPLYQNQGQSQSQSQSSIYGQEDGMNQYLEDAQREEEVSPQPQPVPQPAPRSHRLIESQSLSGQALRLMRKGNIPYIPGDTVSMQRLEIILQSLSMNDVQDYPDASQANDDSDDEYTCI